MRKRVELYPWTYSRKQQYKVVNDNVKFATINDWTSVVIDKGNCLVNHYAIKFILCVNGPPRATAKTKI